MLPDSDERSDTILTVVHKDNPAIVSMLCYYVGDSVILESVLHSVGVHRLANVEIVVFEVGDNLLGVGLGTLLESGDGLL